MSIILLCCVMGAALLIQWQWEKHRPGKGVLAEDGAVRQEAHGAASARLFGMPRAAKAAVYRELARSRTPGVLHFHPGHSWVRVREGGAMEAGADEMTGKLLGQIDAVVLPVPGDRVEVGKPAWTLKHGHRDVVQVAPVSGEVLEVNPALTADPSLVNTAPYSRGWLLRIKADTPSIGFAHLFSGGLAEEWLGVSFARLNALFSPEVMGVSSTAQDGGMLMDNLGDLVNEEQWATIRSEMFDK